ncbi:MAG: metal-sensing transcriptional repressor [Synergistaceae bacterium]|nr:metal-sensing transcriptional repressor [Synergistaceae bacterium]
MHSDHEQTHDHGHAHEHSHESHEYRHVHSPKDRKAILDRLSRAIGHLQSIRRMVEDDRDCSEILIQLAAVRSAITGTGKIIMVQHIEHCIVDAVRNNEPQRIDELKEAINQFIK